MITFNSKNKVFTSSLITIPGVIHGFGTRMFGDGRDVKNIPFKKIAKPIQVHGDRIDVVTGFDGNLREFPNTDGLLTKEKGIALIVSTADCLPILYSDEESGLIGISHQGWRGTELKLAQKMIEKMLLLGASTDSVKVAIGPGIGACCYHRNLMEENFDLLVKNGIKPEQIDYFPFCTSCDEERFFSYRKMGKKEDFPRQFSFIALS